MTRTGTALIVAASAPVGAVLAVVAVSLAAWADLQRTRRRRPRTPWHLA